MRATKILFFLMKDERHPILFKTRRTGIPVLFCGTRYRRESRHPLPYGFLSIAAGCETGTQIPLRLPLPKSCFRSRRAQNRKRKFRLCGGVSFGTISAKYPLPSFAGKRRIFPPRYPPLVHKTAPLHCTIFCRGKNGQTFPIPGEVCAILSVLSGKNGGRAYPQFCRLSTEVNVSCPQFLRASG